MGVAGTVLGVIVTILILIALPLLFIYFLPNILAHTPEMLAGLVTGLGKVIGPLAKVPFQIIGSVPGLGGVGDTGSRIVDRVTDPVDTINRLIDDPVDSLKSVANVPFDIIDVDIGL